MIGNTEEYKIVDFDQHRNDLFANIHCKCPDDCYKDSPIAHLMQTKIKLSGYNDDYFFDVVNKEPRVIQCKCGQKYEVQWRLEGIAYREAAPDAQ